MRRLAPLLVAVACLAGCGNDDTPSTNTNDVAVDPLIVVPDVTGRPGDAASDLVKQKGFEPALDDVGTDPTGCTVISQDPPGGTHAAPNAEITLTLQCDSRDWEAQKGDAWDEFSTAYVDGFKEGCTQLFRLPPDKALFTENEQEYRKKDCVALAPDDASEANEVPTSPPTDPAKAGRKSGFKDGCGALFDDLGVDSLTDGGKPYTAADCVKSAR